MAGGAHTLLTGAPLADTSMATATRTSLEDGAKFFGYHGKQHGGFVAPVVSGDQLLIAGPARNIAGVAGADKLFDNIKQFAGSGGGKRKKRTSNKKRTQRKSRSNKKRTVRKNNKRTQRKRNCNMRNTRNRKQNGGGALTGAEIQKAFDILGASTGHREALPSVYDLAPRR